MFKVNNVGTRMTSMNDLFLVPSLLTLNLFHLFISFSSVSIADFEQVSFCLVKALP